MHWNLYILKYQTICVAMNEYMMEFTRISNLRTFISPENSEFSIKKNQMISFFKTFKVMLLDFAWELDWELGWDFSFESSCQSSFYQNSF